MSETIYFEAFEPNPGQAKFLRNLTNTKVNLHLYVGGAGAGKTQGVCQAIMDCAVTIPGNRVAVVRKFAKDLKATVIDEFLKTVPPNFILEYNKQDKVIKLLTMDPRYPSEIHFRGMDEKERWGSSAYGQIFIVEANEIEARDFTYTRHRLRWRPVDINTKQPIPLGDSPYVDAETGRMLRFTALEFNPPEQMDHWLRQLWLHRELLGKTVDFTLVEVSTYDNKANLDPEYLKILESLPEHEKERMLYGKPGRGVYGFPCTPEFDSHEHTFDSRTPRGPMHWYRGWDFGWVHPACVWGELDEETLYIWFENFGTKLALRDFVKGYVHKTENLVNDNSSYTDYIDHQAANQHTDKTRETSKSILRSYGYSPRHKYSKPRDRADLINHLLQTGKLKIHKNCSILLAALGGGWHREEDSDEPEKDGFYDHIADALGYLVWGIYGAKGERKNRLDEGKQLDLDEPKEIKSYFEPTPPARVENGKRRSFRFRGR